MILWPSIGIITVLVLVLVSWPMWFGRQTGISRRDYDLAVYRDQLSELERDIERGVLTGEQAKAARLEIQRRILAVGDTEQRTASRAISNLPAFGLIVIAIPAAAIAGYLFLGNFDMPDQPLVARDLPDAQATAHANQQMGGDIAASAAKLAARLEEEPGNIDGWILLARSYDAMGQQDKALATFERAIKESDGRPDVLSVYGEVLVEAAGGMVTPKAEDIFQQVLAKKPDDPRAQFFLGQARAEAGDAEEALKIWTKLEASSPDDAGWLGFLRKRMTDLAELNGLPLPEFRELKAASRPAPSEADVAAIANMSPEERQAMITDMIGGLEARLAENPNDKQGWQMLARSYRFLGDEAKAAEAEAKAAALNDAPAAPAAEPKGPSQADMVAAADMTPEDRQAMIKQMVGNLEARLAENPDDAQGWQMLARSYRVMGETAKAAEAEAKFAALSKGLGAPAPAKPQAGDNQSMVRSMARQLEARLAEQPDDIEGWRRLGKAYDGLGEAKNAVTAYQRAADLAPDRIDLQWEHARAIERTIGSRDNRPPSFFDAMRRINQIAPTEPEPQWYLGLEAKQQDRPAEARRIWTSLLSQLSKDSPQYGLVKDALDALPVE